MIATPTFIDPTERFGGTVAILAPHMDDEVLACGGTMARIREKRAIHVVYATDGSLSPVPAAPWLAAPPGLVEIRSREAREALGVLGVPSENLHFLGLPDGRLRNHAGDLERALTPVLDSIDPAHVLAPFRYDRHPDHLAVNRFATAWIAGRDDRTELVEYFVYYRSRLLPGGDLRTYIRSDHRMAVDIGDQSATKRRALERFESQTRRLFDFQTRPILTKALLDEVCRDPEQFVRYSAGLPGPAIFEGPVAWIRLAHRVEPLLKKPKDRILELLRRSAS